MGKTTEAQMRATNEYRKRSTKNLMLRFYPAEMELFEHLEKQPNKSGYVKDLIRSDMEASANLGERKP